ncbi:MAG: hypothetical protein R2710_28745 [Acidimicrobiales bacterium]
MRQLVDFELVGELCRAVLAARRLGCHLVIVDPDPAVAELLDLAGVGDLVERRRCVRADACGHGVRRYLR